LIDVATFNLVNLALLADRQRGNGQTADEDWLFVHLALSYSTLAIVRADRLVFYRNRVSDSEGSLADLVHQTAMYYEDRLGGGGFSRVLVAGSESGAASEIGNLKEALEGRLRSNVEILDPRRVAPLTDRISAPPELLASLAAPIGLVLREG
jgi:hypothetical protein